MENFMDLLEESSDKINNICKTENGAIGYRTTGKALLDLNFSTSSLRSADETVIIDKYEKAFDENPELALKWLFFARDIRQGMGERRIFTCILKWLSLNHTDMIRHLIIPEIMGEYGYWKDIFTLFDTPLEDAALYCIQVQLKRDIDAANENKPISLLAKWMPSINTSSEKSRKMAKKIQANLLITEEDYRKKLAALRKYLSVVERQMSDGNWSDIDYEKVPSIANMKYKNAFLKHDLERREDYISKLAEGDVKINSKDLYPYQITSKATAILKNLDYYDPTRLYKIQNSLVWRLFDKTTISNDIKNDIDLIQGMWDNVPNLVPEDANVLVVRDGSGSMECSCGAGSNSALDIADSLAIYFAEHLKGAFHNKFMTFSSRPQLITFPEQVITPTNELVKTSILDKVGILHHYYDCSNTNIEKVFMLVLETAINNNLKQDELPNNILIISDMEFDNITDYPYGKHSLNLYPTVDEHAFTIISKRYAQYGYKLPRVIFWNVASRTGSIPITENELGVALVSGFSPNIMKMVMSCNTDPYDVLIETLTSDRYKAITRGI